MDPNRRPDVVVLIRQIQTRLARIDPRPDGSHAHKTRVSGVLQNLIKIFDKLIAGQVSVCIKKRHGFVFELLFRTNIRSAKKRDVRPISKPDRPSVAGIGQLSNETPMRGIVGIRHRRWGIGAKWNWGKIQFPIHAVPDN